MTPEQQTAMQAHVDKVIASDGVDDEAKVRDAAHAMRQAARTSDSPALEECVIYILDDNHWDLLARAALGALRALEGE